MAMMYIGEINSLIWRLMAGVSEILAFRHGGTSTDWLKKYKRLDILRY